MCPSQPRRKRGICMTACPATAARPLANTHPPPGTVPCKHKGAPTTPAQLLALLTGPNRVQGTCTARRAGSGAQQMSYRPLVASTTLSHALSKGPDAVAPSLHGKACAQRQAVRSDTRLPLGPRHATPSLTARPHLHSRAGTAGPRDPVGQTRACSTCAGALADLASCMRSLRPWAAASASTTMLSGGHTWPRARRAPEARAAPAPPGRPRARPHECWGQP